MKYSHSKTKPLLLKQQRVLDGRTVAKQITAEYFFGAHYPKFGAALGVSYDGSNGIISKINRASSVA